MSDEWSPCLESLLQNHGMVEPVAARTKGYILLVYLEKLVGQPKKARVCLETSQKPTILNLQIISTGRASAVQGLPHQVKATPQKGDILKRWISDRSAAIFFWRCKGLMQKELECSNEGKLMKAMTRTMIQW